MDLRSHIAMSSIIISNMETKTNKKISRFFFKLGSTMPDVSPITRISEHHISVSQKYVKKFIRRAQDKNISSFRLSYLLGKTSHYIADTFCAAHNIEMGKNLAKHYSYEKALAKALVRIKKSKSMHNLTAFQNFDDALHGCVIEYILKNNKNYIVSHDGTNKLENLLNDIVNTLVYSLHALTAMIHDYTQIDLPTNIATNNIAA